MLPAVVPAPTTEPIVAPTRSPRLSALALVQKMKRLQMLRSPEQLVDTLLVCLEMQRQQIARIAKLETEVKTLRSRLR